MNMNYSTIHQLNIKPSHLKKRSIIENERKDAVSTVRIYRCLILIKPDVWLLNVTYMYVSLTV